MFIDFREKDRDISVGELPPVRGSNLLLYGTMLQPSEPPGQGSEVKDF